MEEAGAIRIRLEGRLEALELAARSLEELEKLLRGSKWPDPEAVRAHLRAWEAVRPTLADAQSAAERSGASAALTRLSRAEESLERLILRRFKKSAISRGSPSERLTLWKELLDTVGKPERTDAPIAEVSETLRSWTWWFLLQLLSIAVLIARQTVFSLGLVIAVVLAFALTSTKIRYRLYRDALVRDCEGEPTLHLPLTSFEGDAVAGTTLQGLVDLPLGTEKGFPEFCAAMNQLAKERLS